VPDIICFADVPADTARDRAALEVAFARVLDSGRFVFGPEVAAFERELAWYLGSGPAFGVNTGTDALVMGLLALGTGPGDEIVTTGFTFIATAESILRVGAKPVFADVDPATLSITAATVEPVLTPRTRAILLVEIYGHCAGLDEIVALCRDRRIALVEDSCQAIGSKWRGRRLGSIGDVGTFSFYPTKNLAALGDAGAVTANRVELAPRIDALRHHGVDSSGRYATLGYSSRLGDLQAAFLRARLGELEAENERRRAIAARYDAAFAPLFRTLSIPPEVLSNRHQYALLLPGRDALRAHLQDNGVETATYYDVPCHLEPAIGLAPGSLPVTEQACREVVNLPIRASLADREVDRIIELVVGFGKRRA
jgi:dTDP-4-amino-4,6-dideoxygalactose transaminase